MDQVPTNWYVSDHQFVYSVKTDRQLDIKEI